MEGIPLTDELLNDFKNGSPEGFSGEEDSGPDKATEQLNEAVGWLLKTADSALRKKDERLGTDHDSIGRISELSVLVAKRNFSDSFLRNSPELLLGTILAGLAVEKAVVFKTIQEEQAQQSTQEEQPEAQEDNEQ